MKATTILRSLLRLPSRALILVVKGYKRFVSPLLPPSCRYHPTCSTYTIEALSRHGLLRGSLLSVYRIVRCNPLSRGGYDPVPEEVTVFPFRRF